MNISNDFETNKARFLELDQLPHTDDREESNLLTNWFRAQAKSNPELQTKEQEIQALIQVQREHYVTKKPELMPANFYAYQCRCGFKTHQPRALVYHTCPKEEGAQSE